MSVSFWPGKGEGEGEGRLRRLLCGGGRCFGRGLPFGGVSLTFVVRRMNGVVGIVVEIGFLRLNSAWSVRCYRQEAISVGVGSVGG